MKVTFCTSEYDNLSGGQNTWLCRFLPKLRGCGIESRVLCFTLKREEELPTVRSLRQAGFTCTTVSDEENKYTEQRVRWLLERLADDPADVFVINMVIPAAYYAGRFVREAGIPTVGICHVGVDHFLYPGLLDQFVLGRTGYQVSAFVCVSKYLEQDVLKRNPEGILVRSIPCGVPVPKDVTQKPSRRLRIAYVGRLAEEAKRISEVTHALCRAVREVPDTEAFIYGDGEERAVVERILREEGNGWPVHLVGRLENDQVSKHLLKCHVVVLLSDWEGLGLSLLEGMACGLVPIGFRHARGGAPELIEDGVTGLLVDDRGDGFVAAVRRLREDPGLWKRLARSARARVETEYSEEICAARWQKLLGEVVAGSRAPRKPLRIPCRLHLPPVHPALAVMDDRILRPHQRLIGRARRFVDRAIRYFVTEHFLPVRRFISRRV
jgi:colanic acid/amylovoran biosynthesis glycosyltransferase